MLKLRIHPDPVLLQVCKEVTAFDETLKANAEMMLAICKANGGIGLAANQVGLMDRIFVSVAGQVDRIFVNPVILSFSKETENDVEGCLSDPGRKYVVKRSISVVMRYQTINGEIQQETEYDLAARIWQHELDHLDGINIRDKGRRKQ